MTAAGFQLKGSGWYATDFRGGNSGTATARERQAGANGGHGRKDSAAPVQAPPGAAATSSSTSGGTASAVRPAR
jgi:hypothetical protein